MKKVSREMLMGIVTGKYVSNDTEELFCEGTVWVESNLYVGPARIECVGKENIPHVVKLPIDIDGENMFMCSSDEIRCSC
jgi:hypothetical protein